LFVQGGRAQQSYRSYQQLSGRGLKKADSAAKKPSASHGFPSSGLPMRFKGWKHPGKSRSEYLAHFSRPRARAAHAELLKNAAAGAAHSNARSTQFAPSALPGFLLRDSLPAGFIPTAVAAGDFNGDGKLDFVVANGGDNNLWLYFGNGNGTFSLPIIVPITLGQSPTWIATGDLRGIGRTDLIVAEADTNSAGVFLSNGDGTFVEGVVALPGSATFLLVGDFNNDGKLDIVAPMDDGNPNVYIAMLPGLGNGTFGSPVNTPLAGYGPAIFWASSADLNGDGFPDLVLSSGQQDISIQVYLNDGNGTFTAGQVVSQSYEFEDLTSVLFDANGDGNTDVIFGDESGTLWVYDGNGDGTFNTSNPGMFGIGDVGYGIAAADVNGDGHLDVILSGIFVNDLGQYGTEAGDQICVLEGDGKGNFSFPIVYRGDSSSYSMAVGDFNGDGHPDVVTANQDNDSTTVFLNNGTGGYGAPGGNWVGYEGGGAVNAPMSGVLMSDIDNNGSTDVAFLEWNQFPDNYYQLTVLLNDGSGNLSAPVRSDAVNSSYGTVGDFALADFRNTGYPDFVAIAPNYNSTNYISFAPNSGGGHFGPVTGTTVATANGVIGVGDFNKDGNLDFVAAGYGIGSDPSNAQGIQVFLGNGDGTFQPGYVQTFAGTAERTPAAVYVGDFNRDGNLDLLVLLEDNLGYTTDADLYEVLGNGNGTFQTGTDLLPNLGPMVVADVNGDGYPDIVSMLDPMAGYGFLNPAQFSVYIGQSDGTFKLTNTYQPYNGGSAFPEQPYSPIFGKYTPMVADFNGDGNLDIAAFQQVGSENVDTFVQLLLGNGDGTFTPTYDVFDFRKPIVTAYAADLTGTGRAELFELNGYRSTYNLLPSMVAPAFQFSIVEDPIPGPQGSGIVLLDVPSTASTTINLTASDPAIKVPATVTVPAGSVSQTFNLTIGSSFNTNHVFSITAQNASTSVSAYGTAVASGAAGFQAQAGGPLSWPNVNLGAGQTESNLGVGVASVNGYSTTVSVQCLGFSTNAQCTVTPSNLTVRPGDSSGAAMAITVGANTPQGSYPALVEVTDGVITQDIPFTLNVGDFTMSLSPQVLQVSPNGGGAYQLTVGSTNSFDQVVNLGCGGLPVGAYCSLLPFTYPPTGASPVTVGVQMQSVPGGNYEITVTGTSGPITHTATAQLQLSGFTASVSPSNATVAAGGSANFNVAVSSVNGFNGTVNFGCSTSSGLISCSFNPASLPVSGNGTAISVLTLTASSQAASAQRDSGTGINVLGSLLIALALPITASLSGRRSRQKWFACACLVLVLSMIPSCGGGAASVGGGGGGGGGGGSQTYSIGVQVSTGNNAPQSAGTISLTVN
jgi:hypothetical protein